MSRETTVPATAPRRGRHRAGRTGGVRCTDLPAVRERMQFDRPSGQHGTSWLRWLFQPPPSGRHTWSFLTHAGGRPRTAFAIILSL
jgi:hypothetical protein